MKLLFSILLTSVFIFQDTENNLKNTKWRLYEVIDLHKKKNFKPEVNSYLSIFDSTLSFNTCNSHFWNYKLQNDTLICNKGTMSMVYCANEFRTIEDFYLDYFVSKVNYIVTNDTLKFKNPKGITFVFTRKSD